MKPLPQVSLWLALFALVAAPPHPLSIPHGYQTAEMRRAEAAWERACELALEAWPRVAEQERTKDMPTVVDAIIAGLLANDDRDSAVRAGRELTTDYEVWKAARAASNPLATAA